MMRTAHGVFRSSPHGILRRGRGLAAAIFCGVLGAAAVVTVTFRSGSPPGTDFAPASDNPAQDLFVATEIDLGRLPLTPRSERRTESFEVINSLSHPVAFLPFVASCGCVSAHAVPTTLQPGERGAVLVTIQSGQAGKHTERVFASTDDPDSRPVELRIHWHTIPPVELHPTRVDFGTVRPESRATQTLTFAASEFSDVNVDDLEVTVRNSDDLVAAIVEAGQVELTLTTTHETGANRALLVVSGRSDAFPEQTVPVTWKVQPLVYCEPPSLSAGVVAPGAAISKVFVVRSDGPPLDSQRVGLRQQLDDGLVAVFETVSDSVATVRVEMTAPELPGVFERRFRLPTPAVDSFNVEAALTGVVRSGDHADTLDD